MVWIVIAIVIAIVAALYWFAFHWAPNGHDGKLKASDTGAHLMVSLVTAGGIVLAGILYLAERQWAPRFDVEVNSNLVASDDSKKVAILQVDTKITNQSRTTQTIEGYEVGAVGLRAVGTSAPDQFGDLPGDAIQSFKQKRRKKIRAGETDHAYAELLVPCIWKNARVIVKVPAPPYTTDTPPDQRLVYERKSIISLASACSPAA